ncbi:hypothetical protein OHV05_36305 (plasmid) [Kitasatospora sp. NBC_00070]|uniref:hypothetical protein n=1 Tax=Kitasatospora sp. NBC_00070 TaxID=2975962 RepID=UPI002F91413B
MSVARPIVWVAWNIEAGAPHAIYADKPTAQRLTTKSYGEQEGLDPGDDRLQWESSTYGELIELVDRGESTGWYLSPYPLLGTGARSAKPAPTGSIPSSQQAYARAPSVALERQYLLMATYPFADASPDETREYLLRHAAMADRISLQTGDTDSRVSSSADQAALKLAAHDRVGVEADPRGYVRQQYLLWKTNKR